MTKCPCCQVKTKNPKYCSRSCAAKINNKVFPKREKFKINCCIKCDKKLSRYKGQRKTQLCLSCFVENKIENTCKLKKKDFVDNTHKGAHKYEKIRQHAKRYFEYKKWKMSKCEKCNYDKHTELCHIKPIHSFSDNDTLEIINSKQNIIFLCPNCHWEFDNLK